MDALITIAGLVLILKVCSNAARYTFMMKGKLTNRRKTIAGKVFALISIKLHQVLDEKIKAQKEKRAVATQPSNVVQFKRKA